jgi:hypothetical protein
VIRRFRAWLTTVTAIPWSAVSRPVALVSVVCIIWLLLLASTGDRWVPILDHANLVFHEAGHLLVGIFSPRMSVYGGVLGQLLFPVVFTINFWSRRHTLGFALSFAWLCESMLNNATYMGDARAMDLPLIGGLDPETHHDWREIFRRWGILDLDTAWAALNRLLAWVGGLGVCAWLVLGRANRAHDP